MFGQFEGHIQHIETEESHPCGPVCLAEGAPIRNGLRAIKRTNIVESKESTLKDILTVAVLPVHPPGEVEEKLLEHPFQEFQVLSAIELSLDFKHSECRPVDTKRIVSRVSYDQNVAL